jgi:uncharacterized repeat protein (TIGR01451 family)
MELRNYSNKTMNRKIFATATLCPRGNDQHESRLIAPVTSLRRSASLRNGVGVVVSIILTAALLFGAKNATAAGTWVPLNNPAPGGVGIDTMLMLPDGTIMAAEGVDPAGNIGSNWWRLTPDIHGSYLNGTWSQRASMHDSRLYYTSEVMPDGRVFVAGAEYGTGGSSAEVYDYRSDTWTQIPVPSGLLTGVGFYDMLSEILPNGNVLAFPVQPAVNGTTMIFNRFTDTITAGPGLVRGVNEDEATAVLLPDSSILLIDSFTNLSERYIPAQNKFVNDAVVPVQIYDTNLEEMGPAFLLPNGIAFFTGNVGKTALYTPTGNANPGAWVAGPNEPTNLGLPDSPGAMMVNGKILIAFGPTQTNFESPTTFYEFDYQSNVFTQVPTTPDGANFPSYLGRMLDLPDGTVLFSESGSQLYVYVPDGSPLLAGKPVISSISSNPDGSYLLAGTGLNGISQGASYGDDAQMNSNYPLIRMTDSQGRVFYARTFNWSSTGVMTGSQPVTTEFSLSGIPGGVYSLVVIANGISSDPVEFVANAPALTVLSNTISGGNGTGRINPNGCVNLSVLVTNEGNLTATHVQGVLVSETPGVIIGLSSVPYPDIASGASAANLTPFTISTEPSFVCGTPVSLELILKCDQLTTTNPIQIATGTLGPPQRFDNSTPISITSGNLGGTFSPVAVSGIGTIGKVTVSVWMTNTYDEFMQLQLISPNGTSVTLAQADGGTGANFGSACSPDTQRTTFDDAATQSINLGVAPLVGTYAPVQPLSTFNLMTGTNVTGVWQLNVINEFTGGATLNCWSLFISPELCVDGGGQCPGADLSISMSANPLSTPVGGPLTYTLSVSNAGPSPASNAVVTQTLPLSVVYQGAVASQGSVSQLGNQITFSLGTVGIQSNATITVTVIPTAPGLVTSTATVGSPASDPNPANNSASASVLVTRPSADLSVSMSVVPPSVPVNGQATFSINVTNNGPATALGVTLTNFLPANGNLVSASTTQGTVAAGGTIVSIGSLASGTGATATLILSPTVVGTAVLTSTAGLDPSETDPLPGNNTARASITVVPAADLGVSVVVSPNPTVSGGNYSYVVSVTNGGPATASTVTMNQVLPPTVTFVSTSQASAVDHNGVISWSLTNMPSGTVAKLTNIVTAPVLLPGVPSNNLISTFTVFGQPSDPQTNNNFLLVNTIELRPMAVITSVGATLTSESFQPANGAVDPGETVGVQFQLQNVGNIPTTNLVATLQTNGGVVPVAGQGQATYGVLAPGGGTATGQFMLTASPTNGQQTLVALLQLQDGSTNLGLVSFSFTLPAVSTFWNHGLISIPSAGNVLTNAQSGPADPYPSSNLVFGITTYVSGVTVTVSNLEHTFPHDINMLLVGPGGQSSILMAGTANHSSASSPVTITFDQSASGPVPATGSLFSGSYQPAEYNSPVFTNAPGVSPPYGTSLGVFTGVPANGWWDLYIYDGATGDYGAISNGWALTVTSITPVNQITDIGVGVTASASQITVGGSETYTITVTNSGTNAATVFLTNTLSSGLQFVSNSTGGFAPYQQVGQAQYYNLGTVSAATNVTIGFVAATTGVGIQTSTVNIGSSLIDPNTNNNMAVASVSVQPPTADISAAISASITSNAVIGSNVVYTLAVSNGGPSLALNVTGVLGQGVSGSSNLVFSNNFGNIAAGTIASALFTNALTTVGQLTNTWIVSTASTDPVATNNVASLRLGVSYPEPVIVAGGDLLVAESFVPPNGAIDSNETVTVSFTLANIGAAATTNLTATLQAVTGVTPITASQSYGAISPQSSSAKNFQFTARGILGSTIVAVLSLSDNGYPLGTVSFPFVLSAALSFTNNAAITIPDSGPATPYPAGIAVSTTNAGVIGKVTATLLGFSHTYPRDVNVLLVGPAGQKVVLMAHTGGPYSVTNLTLTFDDNAASSLPATNLVSGTNLPTLILPQDFYPGIPIKPTGTSLGIFNGGNPNGLWSLYVYDDAQGNSGSILNGWALNISLVNAVNPPNSLALAMTHSPEPVVAGNFLTYQITVTNIGTNGVTNVSLTDTLPANVILNAAAATQGTVNTNTAGVVSINLGTITNAGDTASATVTVLPSQAGQAINSASVTNTITGSGATAVNAANVINLAPFLVQATSVNNNLRLVLQGQSGQYYVIQTSTNLVSWTTLSTNQAVGNGSFTFTNSLANGPELFYRALHFAQ